MKKALLFCALFVLGHLVAGQNVRLLTDDFVELTDAKPHDSETVWKQQPSTPQISWGSIDVRYPKLSVPQVSKNSRWAWNSWPTDPLRDSRFRTWSAGDCYQIYPGPRSSIRWERVIEGIQDAEKIRLLREEFQSKNQKSKLDKLNNTVSRFIHENLTPENAGEMVNSGRKVLNSL